MSKGWNDVGFHGSNQIPTPNIDALAYTGIILNNYYVLPICTPSRSALMTGKYPIYTGMQHRVISGGEPWGLGLDETILPQYLKRSGYATAIVGKWHLGHFKKDYLPKSRGFDSHYGYWTGRQDYYDHTAIEKNGTWGYDMRRGMTVSWDDYGNYTTDLLTNEAVSIIHNRDKKKPLFLYMAHLATHSGNPYNPLQAPENVVKKFDYIKNENRRLFAGMLTKLDESVGKVVAALEAEKMLDNTIIIFSTDNGGPAAGMNLNAASNWPLRGVKDTLWEGGVRGVGLIWSRQLPSSIVSHSMMHITDWLPTLLSQTNNTNPLPGINGINVWNGLSEGTPSERREILLNIDAERNMFGLKYNNWKYLKGNNNDWNRWYGPSGRNMTYNWHALYNCDAAKALMKFRPLPDQTTIKKIRNEARVICSIKRDKQITSDEEAYLFDLVNDPCEQYNLALKHPDIVEIMENKLKDYVKSMVKPRNKLHDPRSDPKYWGYVWTNWMDYPDLTVLE